MGNIIWMSPYYNLLTIANNTNSPPLADRTNLRPDFKGRIKKDNAEPLVFHYHFSRGGCIIPYA